MPRSEAAYTGGAVRGRVIELAANPSNAYKRFYVATTSSITLSARAWPRGFAAVRAVVVGGTCRQSRAACGERCLRMVSDACPAARGLNLVRVNCLTSRRAAFAGAIACCCPRRRTHAGLCHARTTANFLRVKIAACLVGSQCHSLRCKPD